MYIPAGAILGKEQVKVSFRLVVEEAEIQEFLSHSMFEGSVLCSGVFEFEAKLVDAPDGEEFNKFHSDVWIELPHCLSFKESSLKDYSTAFVVSERRGKVEVEEQALFSEGYPYVNLPVRHFSKFCVHRKQQSFAWPMKLHIGKVPKSSASKCTMSMSILASDLQKLSLSSSYESEDSPSYKLSESPITKVRHVREALTRSSSLASEDSPLDRQAILAEVKLTSSKSLDQPARVQLVRQHAVAVDPADSNEMDVDPPGVQDQSVCYSSLDRELLHGASMSLYVCVYQPMSRHKCSEWTADIVFTPLLPQALDVSSPDGAMYL